MEINVRVLAVCEHLTTKQELLKGIAKRNWNCRLFQCNGCEKSLDEDEGLKKKVERILELQPDSVHVGMCTIKKDIQKHCETIKNMTQIFKESGIEVVNGTHNSELLKKTNDI